MTPAAANRSARSAAGWALLLGTGLLFSGCTATVESSRQSADDSTAAPISAAQIRAGEAHQRLMASEGGQLLLRAVDAHGGLDAWYSAATSSYTWEYSNAPADLRFKSHLVADNSTRQIYHDLLELGTPDKPQAFEGSFAWDGENAWISPASVDRVNPRFWAATGYYFESIPFVLADPGVRYEVLPEAELDGIVHDMVKASFGDGVGDSPGDTYTLYINRESGLVDAIRYTVTYGRQRPDGDQTDRPVRETLFSYEDYITVDGLTVPTRFHGFDFENGAKGAFKNEAWASDISFRERFDAARLERPQDSRVQPAPGSQQ